MLTAKSPKNGKILSCNKGQSSVKFHTDKGVLTLEPYTNEIIRITYNEIDIDTQDHSLGVVASSSQPPWALKEASDVYTLSTESIIIKVEKDTSALSYYDSDNNALLREPRYDGKDLDPFDSYRTLLDDTAVIEKVDSADGVKETIINAKKVFDQKLYHGRLSFEWQDGEALYGLGQQEEGTLNLRGTVQYLHQENKKTAMPFLLSSNNYGLLFDTYSPVIFSDTEYGSYLYSEALASIDYYFIHGNNFDDIIGGYRTLTGRATMLPRWVFGYMQSFERYENSDELISTLEEYRRRHIPIDSIVLDWQSWDEGQWGQKSFDQKRFNSPATMIDRIHALNGHFMISIWPNMHECTDNRKEFEDKGGLFQRSDLYNPFDASARDLYWSQAKKGLFDYGVDAWWTDASEPFTPAWLSERPYEPSQLLMKFHNMARTYMAETHTNAYPLVHGQTLYEGQRHQSQEKRVVNLTRSGYTGQQRYGNILWSGDLTAKWSTLKKQIAAGLNLCASGLPYWTLDIGGFFVKRSTAWYWNGDYDQGNLDPAYRELYTRWFQFATFLPILRAHGTDTRREVWQFGEEGTPYYDAIVKFIQLRYQLLPYIYSLAGMVTQEHLTMLRLLAFDYNHDDHVHTINDQFLLGNAMMVCPITEPSSDVTGRNHSTRQVYLPTGNDWYDYWTGSKYTGGRTLTVISNIDQIPLFIPAGAIIPMSDPIESTKEQDDTRFNLHLYTGNNGQFTQYWDDYDAYDYEKGAFATVLIEWDDTMRQLTFNQQVGTYPSMPTTIVYNIYVNGTYSETIHYDGSNQVVQINPL